jgi:hypothetical protein
MEPDDSPETEGGNDGSQPTVEGSHPDGGGISSGSDAGGNKRDPLMSSPSLGRTIAGRDIHTGAAGDLSNQGAADQILHADDMTGEGQKGSPDTGAKGVTGHTGKSESSAHDVDPG